LLQTLLPALRTHVLQAPRLHLDDTTLPLLELGRTTTKEAQLWGYLGAGQRQENGLWVDHPMRKPKTDPDCEQRIAMEVVVDAYSSEQQTGGGGGGAGSKNPPPPVLPSSARSRY